VNNPAIAQVANPGLKPEESIGYDVGFEQPLLNDRVRFGATYFNNRIRNLIVNQFDPGTFTFINNNVGQAKMQGVEAFVAAKVTEQLNLRGDYTVTYTRDETTGLGLLRRPGNKASVTAIWRPIDPLTLSATVLYVGSGVDVNRDTPVFVPRLDTSPYTTVNLAGNYDVNKNVTVFARADNLFNKQYQVPTGFLRPGLGVFGGVKVSN
jgi:vitamin B12 transporter